jgi:hypothetical protein
MWLEHSNAAEDSGPISGRTEQLGLLSPASGPPIFGQAGRLPQSDEAARTGTPILGQDRFTPHCPGRAAVECCRLPKETSVLISRRGSPHKRRTPPFWRGFQTGDPSSFAASSGSSTRPVAAAGSFAAGAFGDVRIVNESKGAGSLRLRAGWLWAKTA